MQPPDPDPADATGAAARSQTSSSTLRRALTVRRNDGVRARARQRWRCVRSTGDASITKDLWAVCWMALVVLSALMLPPFCGASTAGPPPDGPLEANDNTINTTNINTGSGGGEVEMTLEIVMWPSMNLDYVTFRANLSGLNPGLGHEYELQWFLDSSGKPTAKEKLDHVTKDGTATQKHPAEFSPGTQIVSVSCVHMGEEVAHRVLTFFMPAELTELQLVAPRYAVVDESVAMHLNVQPGFDADELAGLVVTWDYGDGTNCSVVACSGLHAFQSGGEFTVKVTASNSINSLSNSSKIGVFYRVQGSSLDRATVVEVGDKAKFSALTQHTTGVSYVWDFGDGSPAISTDDPSITHPFNRTGTFFVTCNLSNPVSHQLVWAFVRVDPYQPPQHHTVEIVTPICATVVTVVVVFFGVAYYRWIYRDRQVEVADFDFLTDTVNSPAKRNSFSPFRRTRASYGTTELTDL